MKIFTAIMLAKFFDDHERAYLDLKSFARVMLIIGIPVGMILMQPDFGTAATFFPLVAVAMFFGGIRWKIWAAMLVVVALLIGAGYSVMKPYQKDRIITFLNPDRDPLWPDLYAESARLEEGKLYLSERPGLGISFNEDFVRQYRQS